MDVSELDSVMLVARLEQPEKAYHPILVTESPITIDVTLVQTSKAALPMLVTESPIKL